jgi:SulP family sulfate permease
MELVAQGIANLCSSVFGGIPATGAIARTATNVKNGGRTPVAGMTHAVTLLLILLFFGKWAALIPMATPAGVLVVVSYNMSEWRSFVSVILSEIRSARILRDLSEARLVFAVGKANVTATLADAVDRSRMLTTP